MSTPQHIDDSSTIVVKFMAKKLTPASKLSWRRQLPDGESKWGRCRFEFDQNCQVYDWLVAYDDLSPGTKERFSVRIEPLACPAENTILLTAEPSSVKSYSSDFLRQFNIVITTQEPWAITHEQIVRTQTAYPWHYGRSDSGTMTSFDQVLNNPPTEKTNLISTVCSSRLGHTHSLHRARFNFTQQLEKELPEMVRYGRGIRPISDKAEVLDSYRYHVAIENDSVPDYFTEKLEDPFLGLTLPFYFGCPNASDYFPAESFIPINIFDFEGSLNTIRQAIKDGEYEKRLPFIKEARRRVLEEHNIFSLLSREIEKRHDPARENTTGTKIYSRRALRNKSLKHFVNAIYEKYRLKSLQTKHRPVF